MLLRRAKITVLYPNSSLEAMRKTDKNVAVIDKRLLSEEFREKLLRDPIVERKREEGRKILKVLRKKSVENNA